MANERDQVIKLLDKSQAALLRQEHGLARDIARAYAQARRELLVEITDRFAALGGNPTPSQLRTLANDVALHNAIRRRLTQMGADMIDLLRDVLGDVTESAGAEVLEQIALLAAGLDIPFFTFGIDDLLELTIAPAIEQVAGLTTSLSSMIINEMRVGLAQGENFTKLANRIYGKNNSIFSRGLTSAELMARRAVMQANNNSRLLFIQQAREQVPGMQKQIIAHFDDRTTKLSMQMHGRIQDADKPFKMPPGPPKPFAREMMAPPFTWNDRDSMVPYHPRFEETSSLKTADMRKQAREALEKLS